MSGKTAALATLLLSARQSGHLIDTLPAELVPATPEDAYAVQDAAAPALGRIVGWKVGAGTPSAEPNCAPLFADLVSSSPARWPAARFALRGVEGEIAFRFATSLPPRTTPYSESEVWDAIDAAHPAIEIVDSRFADFHAMDKLAQLADNQNNGAFCYGNAIRNWRAIDFLRQSASLSIDGKEVAAAVGGNAAGHPRRLLAWLANHCARRGRGIVAGDFATTGTHTGLVMAPSSAQVTVRFAGLGDASVTFHQ
jgi:2-keto-4-pentenoate hydratase